MSKIRLILLLFVIFPLAHYADAGIKDKSFVLVIDPGHGGKDPGAIGATSKEKNINLSVALLLGEYISNEYPDVKIVYTRKKDIFIELNERSNIANRAKADLFISIHTNAVGSKKPYGVETYTLGLARTEENLEVAKLENSVILLEDDYQIKYEGFDPNSSESYIIFEFMQNKYIEQSVNFASYVQNELVRTGRRYDRGVRQAGLLVLRKNSMPSVLVELGFISNKEEERFMNSSGGKQALANSLLKAFSHYKKDHDRKNGIHSGIHTSTSTTTDKQIADRQPANSSETQTSSSSKVVYKVQILANPTKLSKKSSRLKGYKADYYQEKGLYKYTYGESSDWNEISKIRKSLLKDFKDAFIITFKEGVKIPTN